jgi:hypothetical protein
MERNRGIIPANHVNPTDTAGMLNAVLKWLFSDSDMAISLLPRSALAVTVTSAYWTSSTIS